MLVSIKTVHARRIGLQRHIDVPDRRQLVEINDAGGSNVLGLGPCRGDADPPSHCAWFGACKHDHRYEKRLFLGSRQCLRHRTTRRVLGRGEAVRAALTRGPSVGASCASSSDGRRLRLQRPRHDLRSGRSSPILRGAPQPGSSAPYRFRPGAQPGRPRRPPAGILRRRPKGAAKRPKTSGPLLRGGAAGILKQGLISCMGVERRVEARAGSMRALLRANFILMSKVTEARMLRLSAWPRARWCSRISRCSQCQDASTRR
jgi:hypothetical protein